MVLLSPILSASSRCRAGGFFYLQTLSHPIPTCMKTHDSSALLWSCVLRVILMHPSRSKQIPLPPPSEHTSLSLVVNASSLKSKSARFHSLLPQRTLEASPPPAYLPPMHPYCNERIHANISNCCHVFPKGYCGAGPPPPPPANPQPANLYLVQ